MEIYTDGSASPNPGPGGAGVVFIKNNAVYAEIKYYGGKYTTNNKMELEAVLISYRELPPNVKATIFTDSKYVKDSLTMWINSWIKNGWKTSTKKPVKNQDQWKELLQLKKDKPLIDIEWIKAHNGHQWNERADQLANLGRSSN